MSKEFLQYLIETNTITEVQLEECLKKNTSQEQSVIQSLLQENHFTPETLEKAAKQFKTQQNDFSKTTEFTKESQSSSQINKSLEEKLLKIESLTTILPGGTELGAFSQEATDLFKEIELLATESRFPPRSKEIEETEFDADFNKKQIELLQKKERYQVLETLGQGGMGVVQLVSDSYLGRKIALKRIKIKKEEFLKLNKHQKALLSRLQKEASITATLEHPNIIPVYDIQQEENGELYFTMRKVEGKTLREIFVLKKENSDINAEKYDESQLLSIFFKVCDAVSYAHSQGVIHRDLKPDNIMIGEFGEVYVMDWGIAKVLTKTSQESEIDSIAFSNASPQSELETVGGMGTQGYMPPEQAEDAASVKYTADIYALGKILKECFTLFSPMEELNLKIEKARQDLKNLEDEPELHNDLFEGEVPEEILAIIDKATKEKETERYFSIGELTQDLRFYQKNMKVSVKEYGPFEATLKWVSRNKQKVFLGSAAFGMFLFFCCTFYFYHKKEKEKEFKKYIEQAIENKKQAESVDLENLDKEGSGKKIGRLLYALNFLNYALYLYPDEPNTEQTKWEVGTTIINLCYKTKDYQLATYIANDLQKLMTLPKNLEQENLIQQVQKEQTKLETEQLKRVNYWEKRFKEGELEEGEFEDAVFELSQMQEEKVFEKLLSLFGEGKEYFLKQQMRKPDPYKELLYSMIIEVLGRSGKKRAVSPLLETLQHFEKEMFYSSKVTLSLSTQDYLYSVTKALANLKAEKAVDTVFKIRWKMGQSSLFWNKTTLASKKLASNLIQFYSNELSKKPGSAFFYNARGLAKYYKKDFKGALEDYNQALKLNPKLPEIYDNKGILEKDRGNLKEAIKEFDQAIKLNPKFFSAYNGRGTVKEKLKDYQGAIEDFNQAIQIKPDYFSAYTNRGIAKESRGDLKGAIIDYTKSLELNPQNANAYLNRGIARRKQNDLSEALHDLNQAVALNPLYFKAYTIRGAIKRKQKNLKGAIEDYNQAIKLNPKFARAYNNRGNVKMETGDLRGAIRDFEEAIKLDSQDADFYANIGIAKQRRSNFKEALENYNQALKLNPKFALAYTQRGVIKQAHKDFKGALADYNQAIKADPKFAAAYNGRGNIKYVRKDYKGAILDYNRVIKLSPGTVEAYSNRGFSKYLTRDLAGAKKDLKKFLELTKNNPRYKNIYQMTFKIFPDLKPK